MKQNKYLPLATCGTLFERKGRYHEVNIILLEFYFVHKVTH